MNEKDMKQLSRLSPGEWYVPVFKRTCPLKNSGVSEFFDHYRNDSPFYKYLGDNLFAGEDGEQVDGFYNPELGSYVAVDAADGFVQ